MSITGKLTNVINAADIQREVDELKEKTAILEENKQDKLVSGQNIKKLDNKSLLGSGNIHVKTLNNESIFGEGNIDIHNKPLIIDTNSRDGNVVYDGSATTYARVVPLTVTSGQFPFDYESQCKLYREYDSITGTVLQAPYFIGTVEPITTSVISIQNVIDKTTITKIFDTNFTKIFDDLIVESNYVTCQKVEESDIIALQFGNIAHRGYLKLKLVHKQANLHLKIRVLDTEQDYPGSIFITDNLEALEYWKYNPESGEDAEYFIKEVLIDPTDDFIDLDVPVNAANREIYITSGRYPGDFAGATYESLKNEDGKVYLEQDEAGHWHSQVNWESNPEILYGGRLYISEIGVNYNATLGKKVIATTEQLESETDRAIKAEHQITEDYTTLITETANNLQNNIDNEEERATNRENELDEKISNYVIYFDRIIENSQDLAADIREGELVYCKNGIIKPTRQPSWTLVTSLNQLPINDPYKTVIIGHYTGTTSNSYIAMSSQMPNNWNTADFDLLQENPKNVTQFSITKLLGSDHYQIKYPITINSEVSEDDSSDEDINYGYLFAASSTNNWLRTTTDHTDPNSFWNISLDQVEGGYSAHIIAQGENTRNTIKYNLSNTTSIFSCYSEDANFQVIQLYVYDYGDGQVVLDKFVKKENGKLIVTDPHEKSLYISTIEDRPYIVEENALTIITPTNKEYVDKLTDQLIDGNKAFNGISTFNNNTTFNDNAIFETDLLVREGITDSTDKRVKLQDISLANNLENGSGNGAVIQTNISLNNIQWSSDDESIATVDDTGIVTAISNGTTVIRALDTDYGTSTECTVIVGDSPLLNSHNRSYRNTRNAEPNNIVYSLDTTDENVETDNNSYSAVGTYTDTKTTWSFGGNGQQHPWRIGGKAISDTQREVFTDQINEKVTVVSVIHGTTSGNIICSKLTFIVSNNSDFSNPIYQKEIESPTVIEGSKINFTAEEDSVWENAYYKFIYTITVSGSGSANKYIGFAKVDFYGPIHVTSVTLDRNEAQLFTDQTLELTPTVLPKDATDKTVYWTSTNEDVAIVNENGVVTAVGAGATTITVTTYDSKKSDTCSITVIPPGGDNIILNTTTLKLKIGNTNQLVAKYEVKNIADGNLTVTLGKNNTAYGDLSFVQGDHLVANEDNQVIFGSYNTETDSKFVVAAGTADERFNALEVTAEGKVIAGSLVDDSDDDNVLTTKSYVDGKTDFSDHITIGGVELNKTQLEKLLALLDTLEAKDIE